MGKRSATTRLIIKASLVPQETAGVISNLERGAVMRASETDARSVASCRKSTDSYRSELVIALYLFVG